MLTRRKAAALSVLTLFMTSGCCLLLTGGSSAENLAQWRSMKGSRDYLPIDLPDQCTDVRTVTDPDAGMVWASMRCPRELIRLDPSRRPAVDESEFNALRPGCRIDWPDGLTSLKDATDRFTVHVSEWKNSDDAAVLHRRQLLVSKTDDLVLYVGWRQLIVGPTSRPT